MENLSLEVTLFPHIQILVHFSCRLTKDKTNFNHGPIFERPGVRSGYEHRALAWNQRLGLKICGPVRLDADPWSYPAIFELMNDCEIILSCICFIWDSWFKLLRSNIWKVFCICFILCSFSLISKLWLAIFILARFNFPSSSVSLKSFWFPSDINWTKIYF